MESLSFSSFLAHEDTRSKLRHHLLARVHEDLLTRSERPKDEAISAAVENSLDIAIAGTRSKVLDAKWKITPETFHDAFRMTLQHAHKEFHSLLSQTHTDEAFLRMRPEVMIDTSTPDSLLEDRESSTLKEAYANAMSVERSNADKHEALVSYEDQRKWGRPTKNQRHAFSEYDS